jgi:hypothetical protein
MGVPTAGRSHDGIGAPLLATVDATPYRHVLTGVMPEVAAQRLRDGEPHTDCVLGDAVDGSHFERMEGEHAIPVKCT